MRLSKTTALCLAALFLLSALKYSSFLLGGIFVFRDAGYFFLPLREISSGLLRSGEFPFWNDFASNGRALAANPNAGAFWPLSFLLAVLTPSQLVLLHIALLPLSVFLSLRWLRLSSTACLWGSMAFLFSGVFQTLPILFTTLASTIPLPLALAAVAVPPGCGRRTVLGRFLLSGVLIGLSFLGGEPVIAATGAGGVTLVVLLTLWRDRRDTLHRAASWGLLAVCAAGTGMVQLLPAVSELSRSARQESMRPEEGALYWSVRPARILTLLEPRLTGDPFAEKDEEYWGAGTFDAKNPYFYDLAPGLLPLLCLGAAWRSGAGKSALLLAGATALFSFGRFVPGYASAAEFVRVIRYPEKWWITATLFLSAATAIGFDQFREDLQAAIKATRPVFLATGGFFFLLTASLLAVPGVLGRALAAAGLAAEPVGSPSLRSVLFLPLLLALLTLILCWVLSRMWRTGDVRQEVAVLVLAAVFLIDGVRRTHDSCPAAPADLFHKVPPHVQAVVDEMGRGRFYDEAANVAEVAVRRARESAGFDPLRPITGAVFGVRYAGENDIDRMTPAASVAFARYLARTPWSESKVRLLERANVSAARVPLTEPLLPGTREVARFGGDRIVRLSGTRPEFSLARSSRFVQGFTASDFGSLAGEEADAVIEGKGTPELASRPGEPGGIRILKRTASRQQLTVSTGHAGAILKIARTHDPNWKVTWGGKPLPLLRADGFLSAVELPPGTGAVTIEYVNPSILRGTAVSIVTAAGALLAALLLTLRTGEGTA